MGEVLGNVPSVTGFVTLGTSVRFWRGSTRAGLE